MRKAMSNEETGQPVQTKREELKSVKNLPMQKRVERKEDGRHLLYYTFADEQPLPDNSHQKKAGP